MTHIKNKLAALIFLFLCPLVSFSGDPKPLITWSTENGSPIEAMVLAGYRYTPEIKDGNKTLHLVSNPLKKTDREEISSKEPEFAGKFQINK